MLIRISDISGKGFMSFRKPFEFHIEHYEGKTVQIDGVNNDDEKSKSNGSGKSTLLETINWGLFGELCRKNRYKDEVIHKKEKMAFVQTTFSVDPITYTVTRTIERKKTSSLRIWKNEAEMWMGSTYQTKQAELEKILGMNFISFQCYIMFGRDFMNFPDLKSADRARILSDIRGLDKYLEGSKRAGESSKSAWLTLDQTGRELDNRTAKLKEIRATSYAENIKTFEEDRETLILEKDTEIGLLKQGIKNKELETNRELTEIQKQLDSAQKEIDETQENLPDRKVVADRFADSQVEFLKNQNERKSTKERVDEINQEINSLTKTGEGPCPFCNQIMSGQYIQKRINQLGLKSMEWKSVIENLFVEEKKIRDTMRIDRETLVAMDLVLDEMAEKETLILDLKAELNKVSREGSVERELGKVEGLEKQIEEKRKEANPYLALEEKRKGKIKEIGSEMRNIKTIINDLQKQKDYFDFWVDGFKKIRMMIFDTMIDQLETLAQWYLSQYSSELNVIMTTERETRSGTIKDEFHISIVDSNGDEVSYEMYSGGEKQKIRLSISRALAQFIKESCGVDFNLIAFDEPNDALDDTGKDANFDVFQELSEKEGKAVLVTDHDSIFKDRFDHNVMVIKENGESTLHV